MIQKSRYRIPNQKEFRRLEQSVNLIYQTADYFQEYFVGRKMVYSTQKNEVELYFSQTNYMHLCGLYYSEGAEKFFIDCLDKKVNLKSLLIKKDGTTMQKLQVLPSIKELTSPYVWLTGSGKYLRLEFDYSLRTRKQILALTLKDTQSKIVPQSLLNLKSKEVFPKGEPVTCIYSKSLLEEELKQHFLKDGLDWDDYLKD